MWRLWAGRLQGQAALLPRVPLFGGWSTDFEFGFQLPLGPVQRALSDGRLEMLLQYGPQVKTLVIDDYVFKVQPFSYFSVAFGFCSWSATLELVTLAMHMPGCHVRTLADADLMGVRSISCDTAFEGVRQCQLCRCAPQCWCFACRDAYCFTQSTLL